MHSRYCVLFVYPKSSGCNPTTVSPLERHMSISVAVPLVVIFRHKGAMISDDYKGRRTWTHLMV